MFLSVRFQQFYKNLYEESKSSFSRAVLFQIFAFLRGFIWEIQVYMSIHEMPPRCKKITALGAGDSDSGRNRYQEVVPGSCKVVVVIVIEHVHGDARWKRGEQEVHVTIGGTEYR